MESANPPKVARGLAAPAVNLDEAGLIAEDLPCRHCGYNLRTLSPAVQCPECGTSVGRSVHGDFLRFADPNWVQSLSTGALISTVAATLSLIGWVAYFAMLFAKSTVPVWFHESFLIVEFTRAIGIWKLSAPDPGTPEDGVRMNARILARWSLILSLFLEALIRVPAGFDLIFHNSLHALNYANGAVYVAALFTFLRRLFLRIPNEKLATECRWLMCYLIADAILSLSIWVVFTLAQVSRPTAFPLIYCSSLLISFAAVIWILLMMNRLRRVFRESERVARLVWASETPAQGGIP